MKGYTICIFMLMAFIVKAQPPDSLILFSGYILDEDSLPIENAYLVSYRTIRGYSTNEKGFFKIMLLKGDSLMINHLSYERRIIKANNDSPLKNCHYLKFSPYSIKTMDVKYRDISMENFHRNMKLINAQMRRDMPLYRYNSDQNAYAPSPKPQFYGFSFNELYKYIKAKKYKKN